MNDKSYSQWGAMSNQTLIETIGVFIKTNRLNQNRSQDQVSKDAGISRSTLSLLEKGRKVRIDSLIQVLRTLDLLYIMDVFQVQDQISPIAYAKLKKKKRKQASPQSESYVNEEDLGW